MSFFSRNNHGEINEKEPLLDNDDKVKGHAKVTPYANAGLFSFLTFSWLNPLLRLGSSKTLNLDDIPLLTPNNSVFQALPVLRDKFGLCYDGDSDGRVTTRMLANALYLSGCKEIWCTSIMALIYAVSRYVGPYLIDDFVQCLSQGTLKDHRGYFLALTFFVATLVESLTKQHWLFGMEQLGYRLRGAMSTIIYEKGLSLSSQSRQDENSGEFVNLVAVDVQTIKSFCMYLHDSWLVIVQIILGLLLLYRKLGLASASAVFAYVIIMLVNSGFGRLIEKYESKLMESKDNRMQATKETLRNMKILKLQGWEMGFLSKILELRKVESQWLKKYLFNSAMMNFVFGVCTTFVALFTFGTCVLLKIPLETGTILSAIATFRVLNEPIYFLPNAISSIIQLKVSLGRIASFLSLKELQDDVVNKCPKGGDNHDTSIEIVDGNFKWDIVSSSVPTTLQNINLKVSHGMRVAVVGAVGSGKSSLLSCILGEVPKISGTVKLCGTKAYVPQTAWIQSCTIQDNILFGKDMDLEKYDKVLEACCLKKDLEIIFRKHGDQTVIGERGINLSGGQKQRIQIARAIYDDADIYLFDDPFSAVDAHTGSHLFNEVLLGLLSQKTVVYVTHQVEFLNNADLIVVMKDGKIVQVGKYEKLLVPGSDFMELVSSHNAAAISTLDSSTVEPTSSDKNHLHISVQEANNVSQTSDEIEEEQLIKEEEREKGSVGFAMYWKYITTSYRGVLLLLVFLGYIVLEILRLASNYWLASSTSVSKDAKPPVSSSRLITVYASLAIGISICILANDMLIAIVGYTTGTKLFGSMIHSIFHAPMSFFDATPTGRILNRCSTDQSVVESEIASVLMGVVETVIELLGIIFVMGTVAWHVLMIFIPVIFACIWFQRYYMTLARDLIRLRGTAEAPIIQDFVETMSGVTVVRSFNKQPRFINKYIELLNTYIQPDFHVSAAMKWLMIRLDGFSSITFAILLVLLVSVRQNINPALAGVAVAYGLTISNEIQGFLWCLSRCGTQMISVERILQYTSILSEAPLVIEANKPDNSWPSHGEICINNLQVRYAPHLPLVLRGLTCTFPARMKIGIVGRTGCGKSTLLQALLRIVEPTSGRIQIDGIDISSIGLHDLRSRLSIIPQDPIMFQGTIRSNLDPLGQYTDLHIWETLRKCQLGDEVKKMERKLDSNVVENGDNWSMGQRQLICLGRVLLKKSKVLLLDEATASVDTTTDNLIQQRIKEDFVDCTVITIAHRMTSVLDSDKVLLLDNGVIEEFDSPRKLLENKSSAFAQLVTAWSNSYFKNQPVM